MSISPMHVKIVLRDTGDTPEAAMLRAGLEEWNNRFVPPEGHRELAVYAKDEQGELLGGLAGGTYWGWLYIERLWVRDGARGNGLGSALLEAAEAEARARGCAAAQVRTHDFQAPEFYARHGYRECGRLEGLPAGHFQLLLRKELAQPSMIP